MKIGSLAIFASCALAIPSASLRADITDFARAETASFNGRDGVWLATYAKGGSTAAWAVKFDLSKGYRIKTWLGDTGAPGASKATVGAMAEAIYASDGVAPVAGINGDYFDTSATYARPTGMVISDSALVSTGFGRASLTANCYLAETGDHNLYQGKLDCVEGLAYGGQPTASWQLNARGRKVRNAIRTNYCNYPVKAGAINPYEGKTGESAFATTTGNLVSGQSESYYRTLVGFGTNEVGVATNLVLWTNTSAMHYLDAYQAMIDEGCNEVGEFDLGGSVTLWTEGAGGGSFGGATTAHGGYLMRPRDLGIPRDVANGLFVMPPPETPDAVSLNSVNSYPDMEEALLAAVPGDTLATLGDSPRTAAVVSSDETRVALEWEPEARFGAIPWFSAEAATAEVRGGAWLAAPKLVLQEAASAASTTASAASTYRIAPGSSALFEAYQPGETFPRVEVAFEADCATEADALPALLAEAVESGCRAALVLVDGGDNAPPVLHGLALVGGAPAWVPLAGVALPESGVIRAGIEIDLSGEEERVSYLAVFGEEQNTRLHGPSGATWLAACAPAVQTAGTSREVEGRVALDGVARVASLAGTLAAPATTPAWRDVAANAGRGAYAVAVLGDTHFDAAPDTLYHAAYDTSTPNGAYGIAEYRRSAEMWQERMPALLAASSALATTGASLPTRFALQLGDIINGDCNDDAVHLQMLRDALAAHRAPYAPAGGSGGAAPRPFPFLTVIGNHDFRGSPNGRPIYFGWAEPLLSGQIGEECAYPLFSFTIDDDRWIFCDFERVNLIDLAAEVSAHPEARYVFLVTHGPFTPCEDGNNWIWRLSAWKAKGGTGKGVPELFEAISLRRAIVLSGHTHYTSFYRNENEFGGYTEFTANSVWKGDDLAHSDPFPGHDRPSAFGTWRAEEVSAANRAAYDADIALFKPGLREYFLGPGAGHFRLEVTDAAVKMLFYPGAATEPGRVFDLTPGPPPPSKGTILFLQ